MALDQPTEGFRLGQLVFDTVDCCSTLLLSKLPPSIAIDDRAASRNHDCLTVREIAERSEYRQLGG
jgi:hypothetical protein